MFYMLNINNIIMPSKTKVKSFFIKAYMFCMLMFLNKKIVMGSMLITTLKISKCY